MRYDGFWGDEFEGAEVPAAELPLAPDGRHTGDIIKAKYEDLKFMVDEAKNPTGKTLVIEIDVPKAQPVKANVPCHWRGLTEAVCKSAGVHPPQRGEDWDEKQLLGRTVTIETKHVVANSGKEYVRIEKWHPGPAPLPAEVAKRAPARTPAAKVTAGLDADDIPF